MTTNRLAAPHATRCENALTAAAAVLSCGIVLGIVWATVRAVRQLEAEIDARLQAPFLLGARFASIARSRPMAPDRAPQRTERGPGDQHGTGGTRDLAAAQPR